MYQSQQPLFGGFFQQAISTKRPKPQTVDPNFDALNRDAFKLIAHSISSMDEHQTAITIRNNIDEICQDIINGRIDSYGYLFNDVKFIDGFIRAINSIPITPKIRLACNKLTYDYFTSDHDKIPEIKQRCLNISRIVNSTKITALCSLGIDGNTASNLALCRYSSTVERVCFQRLNFALYFKDPRLMTEQMIVYIYEVLIDNVKPLFIATMFEVYSDYQAQEYGEDFVEIYGAVSNAVLDILNNMQTNQIQAILSAYYEELKAQRQPVRFSLRSLSGDYSRISRVVEYFDSIGKYIP